MNPLMRPRNWNSTVLMVLSASLDLYDRNSPEIPNPSRVTAVDPGVLAVIDDPEPRLEPHALSILRAQDDDFPPELDEYQVCQRVGDGETEQNRSDESYAFQGCLP
jgi:hypothetical protein